MPVLGFLGCFLTCFLDGKLFLAHDKTTFIHHQLMTFHYIISFSGWAQYVDIKPSSRNLVVRGKAPSGWYFQQRLVWVKDRYSGRLLKKQVVQRVIFLQRLGRYRMHMMTF
jgi:hypothetical protein